MFEIIENVDEVKLENIDALTVRAIMQSKEQWRDELIDFGLVNDGLKFNVKGSIAPISIAFCDREYTAKFGNSPRITVSKAADNDEAFNKVIDFIKAKTINNSGLTITGYDFGCGKTSKELGSFLIGFENAYRKAKLGK